VRELQTDGHGDGEEDDERGPETAVRAARE
jgi:hypothetical protein